jgi:hypothetical protein
VGIREKSTKCIAYKILAVKPQKKTRPLVRVLVDKKFWEQVIAHYDTDRVEKDSSILRFRGNLFNELLPRDRPTDTHPTMFLLLRVFVPAAACLPICGLITEEGIRFFEPLPSNVGRGTHTDIYSLIGVYEVRR